jgi:hypothetical protein
MEATCCSRGAAVGRGDQLQVVDDDQAEAARAAGEVAGAAADRGDADAGAVVDLQRPLRGAGEQPGQLVHLVLVGVAGRSARAGHLRAGGGDPVDDLVGGHLQRREQRADPVAATFAASSVATSDLPTAGRAPITVRWPGRRPPLSLSSRSSQPVGSTLVSGTRPALEAGDEGIQEGHAAAVRVAGLGLLVDQAAGELVELGDVVVAGRLGELLQPGAGHRDAPAGGVPAQLLGVEPGDGVAAATQSARTGAWIALRSERASTAAASTGRRRAPSAA